MRRSSITSNADAIRVFLELRVFLGMEFVLFGRDTLGWHHRHGVVQVRLKEIWVLLWVHSRREGGQLYGCP